MSENPLTAAQLVPPTDADHAVALARMLFANSEPPIRLGALRLLRAAPSSPALREALARLVRDDDDATVRKLAVAIALREHRGPEVVEACRAATADPDAQVARTAVLSLCEHATEAMIDRALCDALVGYVETRDPHQAGRVGRLLARAEDPRAGGLLVAAVEHGSHFWHDAAQRPIERAETFALLGRLAEDSTDVAFRARVVALLDAALERDTFSYGREAAWRALAVLGTSAQHLVARYLAVPPATHPPSSPSRLRSFEPLAERQRLGAAWGPRLCDATAQLRHDALAIVRWIKLPELLPVARAALRDAPREAREALEELVALLERLPS